MEIDTMLNQTTSQNDYHDDNYQHSVVESRNNSEVSDPSTANNREISRRGRRKRISDRGVRFKIHIDENVPIPPRSHGRRRTKRVNKASLVKNERPTTVRLSRYGLEMMKPKQSYFIEGAKLTNVANSAWQLKKLLGTEFITRTCVRHGVEGIGVWLKEDYGNLVMEARKLVKPSSSARPREYRGTPIFIDHTINKAS